MQEMQQRGATPAAAGGAMAAFKSVISAPSVQAQFKNALGEHKDAFVASLIDLFSGDKSLQRCQPAQLVAEALRAATLKLPLNRALGFSYIVVFNTTQRAADGSLVKVPTPTFIPGYKGYIQLAMRTGQYKTLNADLVYEGEYRGKNKLTGEIDLSGEKVSDKVVGYFCHFQLVNGFQKTLFMTVEEMAQYARRYSPSLKRELTVERLMARAGKPAQGKQVGWEGNFDDMAVKTVVRRLLSKYGILSVEMQGVLSRETELDEESLKATPEEEEKKPRLEVETAEYEEVEEQAPSASEEVAPSSKEQTPVLEEAKESINTEEGAKGKTAKSQLEKMKTATPPLVSLMPEEPGY